MERVCNELVPAAVLSLGAAIPIAFYLQTIHFIDTASKSLPLVKQVVTTMQSKGAEGVIYPAIGIVGGIALYAILRTVGFLVKLGIDYAMEAPKTKPTPQLQKEDLKLKDPDPDEIIRRLGR